MVDMSRRPDRAMFSVRGMGVAERVSTSTWRLISFRRSLWVTPKRCSSSMMSSPRSLNSIPFCSSLWVPMRTSTRPSFASSRMRFWSLPGVKRESTSIRTGKSRKRPMAVA